MELEEGAGYSPLSPSSAVLNRGSLPCWVVLISEQWPDLGLLVLLVLLLMLDLLPLHITMSTSSFSFPESEYPQDCSGGREEVESGGREAGSSAMALTLVWFRDT